MSKPKVKEISLQLEEAMFQYQLSTGVTEKEVADHFGFSASAVTRALWRQLKFYQKKKRLKAVCDGTEFETF